MSTKPQHREKTEPKPKKRSPWSPFQQNTKTNNTNIKSEHDRQYEWESVKSRMVMMREDESKNDDEMSTTTTRSTKISHNNPISHPILSESTIQSYPMRSHHPNPINPKYTHKQMRGRFHKHTYTLREFT